MAVDRPTLPAGRRRIILSALLGVPMLVAANHTWLGPALPDIAMEVGGPTRSAWVISASLLASITAAPLAGRLGDRYGPKPVLIVGLIAFIAGAVLCADAGSIHELIFARTVQGVGAGTVLVLAHALTAHVARIEDRRPSQTAFGVVYAVAGVAGPVPGGLLTEALTWRWLFWLMTAAALVILVGVTVAAPGDHEPRRDPIDIGGVALMALIGTGVLISIFWTGLPERSKAMPIGALAVTALLVGAFVANERRAAVPVLPPRLFTNVVFPTAATIGLLAGAALFCTVASLPPFLQVARGGSPGGSGLALLPLAIGLIGASALCGTVVARTGRYRLLMLIGTTLITVGLLVLARLDPGLPMMVILTATFLIGAGLGLVFPVVQIAVQNATDYQNLGVATFASLYFRWFGGAVGPVLFAAIVAGTLPPHLGDTRVMEGPASQVALAEYVRIYTEGVRTGFLALTILLGLAVVLAWLLVEVPVRVATPMNTPEMYGMAPARRKVDELERVLGVLALREDVQLLYNELSRRAETGVGPGATWLLGRIGWHGRLVLADLPMHRLLPPERVVAWTTELRLAGYVEGDRELTLTTHGDAAWQRLTEARRETLERLLDGWNPEMSPEVVARLRALARDLLAVPAHGLGKIE